MRSILDGTFSDIEVLLIDDGSPNGSDCDIYAEKDKRVRVIRHSSNKGLSAARNEGLRQAQASFVGFIDSDDWIHPNMYNELYQRTMKYNADIVTCGVTEVTDYKLSHEMNVNAGAETIMNGMDALRRTLISEPSVSHTAWGKLYRRSLFENITYPLGRVYEDAATTYKLYFKAERVVTIPSIYYYYFIHKGSISNSGFDSKSMDKLIAANEIIDFILDNCPDLLPYAECFEIVSALRIAADFKPDVISAYKAEYAQIKQILTNPRNKKNPLLSIRHKIMLKLFRFCKPIFFAIWRKRLRLVR